MSELSCCCERIFVCLFIWLLDPSSLHVMRGCEAESCLSVLSAGRHRQGQTCISMVTSGCSPFPMCWAKGTNEIPFMHTQKQTQGAWNHCSLCDIWLHGNGVGIQPKLPVLCKGCVCVFEWGWERERDSHHHLICLRLSVYLCLHVLPTPHRCNYLIDHICFLLMEERWEVQGGKEAENWNSGLTEHSIF